MIEIEEWLIVVLYFYGIALGLFMGWWFWRRPYLDYVLESDDENQELKLKIDRLIELIDDLKTENINLKKGE